MLVGDLKRIRWANSMKNFSLKFSADGGGDMTAVMEQNWKDHTVLMLGGQYMYTPDLALRAGINVASNPVPDSTLNPLFPATIKSHLTFGLGWRMDKDSRLAASLALALAPRAENTNPGTGITSTHRQATLRVNYNFTY
jgi:long-chain fatty acid transport protein